MQKLTTFVNLGLAFFHILFCLTAKADLQCSEHVDSSAALGTIQCVNQQGNSEVIFRRMPAWGGNAGLIVLDICRFVNPKTHPNLNQGLPYSWRTFENATGEYNVPPLEPECLRRWCTDDYRYFYLSINSTAVYIPPNIVAGLSLAITHEQFEVSCQTLSSSLPEAL